MIIAICLAPAASSLQTSIQGQQILEAQVEDSLLFQARFEEVLNEPFTSLKAVAEDTGSPPSIPTSYSSTVTTSDDSHRINCKVYIARYDGDNADEDDNPFTGTDAGLLYLKITIEGTSDYLETLVYQ